MTLTPEKLDELERLAEALALLPDEIAMIEHNPDEGPLMFCCGRKVTLSWLHDLIPTHDKECWYARMRAMRDYDPDREIKVNGGENRDITVHAPKKRTTAQEDEQ